MDLKEIKAAIRKMDKGLSEDDEAFKAQVVLLASLEVGPNVRRLQKFTGYPPGLVNKFSYNLRKSGIWKAGKVYGGQWFDEDGGIAFNLDCCVAMGLMQRTAA